MQEFRADAYGQTIAEILALCENGRRLMPLVGTRCASAEARRRLLRLDPPSLFDGRRPASAQFAEAARSGLFLYFSCLDEAHRIAQDIPTPTGSYWHGIMHRQEPDFGNAAYWFRRVKEHEIFSDLRKAAAKILPSRPWDPFDFIDACEEVYRGSNPSIEQPLREIQRAEWQLLFDFCCRRALETSAS